MSVAKLKDSNHLVTATSLSKRPTLGRRLTALRQKYELALLGGIFFALVVLGTIFAPWLSPYDPIKQDIPSRLLTPSAIHWFGTDESGRDNFTRVLYGGRPILTTGISSVLLALLIGMGIGTAAGYRGGLLDDLLMRAMDIMLSFPTILLAILIVASLGTGLINTILAIAFSLIPTFARLVRSIVITLVREQYVTAAHAVGTSDWQIIAKHIFPNMIPPIIVQATATLAIAISYSSALSFLGLGVEPPRPDWGLMVSQGQRLIFDAIYIPFFPGLAITLTVLSVNYIGDGLRDHLDPTLRNR
ncbi:MAG: ABC transporter permease [Chloroflexi bacterium]|nr:ABC transporter permease [Chloroflexota bacterium]